MVRCRFRSPYGHLQWCARVCGPSPCGGSRSTLETLHDLSEYTYSGQILDAFMHRWGHHNHILDTYTFLAPRNTGWDFLFSEEGTTLDGFFE